MLRHLELRVSSLAALNEIAGVRQRRRRRGQCRETRRLLAGDVPACQGLVQGNAAAKGGDEADGERRELDADGPLDVALGVRDLARLTVDKVPARFCPGNIGAGPSTTSHSF